MRDKYYVTKLKLTETHSPALRFAVIDDYSKIVGYFDTEDRALLVAHALNEYVAESNPPTTPHDR